MDTTATASSSSAASPSRRPRANAATSGVVAVERANALIVELGIELDDKLRGESRQSERLRMLRETTNRITRAANDAVQAYVRTKRMLDREMAKRDAAPDAEDLHIRLVASRRDLLASLSDAGRRYPRAAAEASEPPGA